MSRYQPYPEYKDSGVEWIGDVPAHWEKCQLKNLAAVCNGRDYKTIEDPDGQYPVIGSGGQFAWASECLYDGESVLFGRKGTIDKPLYINGPFWTVDTMFYTSLSKRAIGKYVYYVATIIPYDSLSTNTALPSMTQEDLSSLNLTVPDTAEQSQIATFLDRETTRIDTLVEKKQRFIELLEEKRQAVITQAVTKGLDPNVPMRDSGVEWIGEVPAHWGVKRLKRVCKLQTDQVSAGGQAVALENIEGWTGRLLGVEQGSDTEGVPFKKGDVLFGKLRPYLAKVHLAEVDGVAVGDFFVLRLTEGLPSYLWRYLLSPPLIDLLNGATVGAKMPRVSWQQMASTFAPVPPKTEQSQIATFLDRETTRIDTLIEKTRESIERLKERRAALITAAVTGKIDVREEATA